MLQKSRAMPQRGDLCVSRSPYCPGSLDPVGDVPFHCVLLLGLWGWTKGNELCINPWFDQGPAELAGPALDSMWLCKDAAVMCQGTPFVFRWNDCLPWDWISWGCFPLTDWGMGTALLVLRGEKKWTKTFKSYGIASHYNRRWFLLWSLSLGRKQKRCSPAVLTTGFSMSCYPPSFTFVEVETDLIKITQSRNGRTGSGGALLPSALDSYYTFNMNNEEPAPRGWYTVSFSLKPLMPFQLLPWSGLFVKDLLSGWRSFLLPLCKNSMLSLVSEGIIFLTA